MTPKEKAKDLVYKMYDVNKFFVRNITPYEAKQRTIIFVDEIIKDNEDLLAFMHCNSDNLEIKQNIQYWQEVKKEIEKL